MTGTDVVGRESRVAGYRSMFYSLMAQAFQPPERGILDVERIRTPWGTDLQDVAQNLPFEITIPSQLIAPEFLDEASTLETLYLESFDLGGPRGPACFLYEGEYGGGRLKVMEDVLRFYDHFGVEPRQDGNRDRPDHVAAEFELVHFLAFREASLVGQGGQVDTYRRAQRDFLRLHLVGFVAEIAERIGTRDVPFYSALSRLAHQACEQDLRHLVSLQE